MFNHFGAKNEASAQMLQQYTVDGTSSVNVIRKKGNVELWMEARPIPTISDSSPQVLACEAAAGRRRAAWPLLQWIMDNGGASAAAFIDSLDDDRLARYLLEWIALGTWAGKPFVVPASLRSPVARMHLCTVFQPKEGIHASRAVRVLIEALHDDRPALRRTAAEILGRQGMTSAVPALIEALHDPVERVQLQVVKALGRIKDPRAIPALVSLLHCADERLVCQIFIALAQMGSEAVPSLIEISKGNSTWLRWQSIYALGKTNDLRALPTLVQGLADDTDDGVVWAAAKGLTQFDRLSVGPVLRLLIFSEATPWLVGGATYVLNHQHDSKLEPYIRPVLQQMHEPGSSIGTMLAAQKALTDLVADGLGEECGLGEKLGE